MLENKPEFEHNFRSLKTSRKFLFFQHLLSVQNLKSAVFDLVTFQRPFTWSWQKLPWHQCGDARQNAMKDCRREPPMEILCHCHLLKGAASNGEMKGREDFWGAPVEGLRVWGKNPTSFFATGIHWSSGERRTSDLMAATTGLHPTVRGPRADEERKHAYMHMETRRFLSPLTAGFFWGFFGGFFAATLST